ncbi:sensor histidine kinase [Leptothrix discophora]|uniref:histidine kinase n=1 Tax=Leptothrix discophora TaxID=89 RepID=A0ABT9G6F5_LEPDI|nr:PAS domain-containing sensor histidine kinase [Leptothrix discophora]MDP4301773.1 PAS domain-containing sensor histidine kinase [Leptothrix discophora]
MRLRLRLPLRLLPRSLVGRVFALYTVTLLAFVALGLALFYRYQLSVELEEAQLRADALSAVIQPAVTDSAVIGDYDTIHRTLESAVHHPSFASASYIDLAGGVVKATRNDPPLVAPPAWLVETVQSRLYDTNMTIRVGGRDYGVLRLGFAAERIAGALWQQTRIALALGLLGVVGGLLLIRWPLVRWLGKLNRVHDFDQAMRPDGAPLPIPSAEDAPLEFRETFEVLGRAAASVRGQREQAAVSLEALRRVLEDLTPGMPATAASAPDDLAAISLMISELVRRLRERGAQLDAIFALSADGFVSFDARGHVNYVSPAFTLLTGQPETELLGCDERAVERLLNGLVDGPMGWRGFQAMRQAAAVVPATDADPANRPAEAAPARDRIETRRPVRRTLEVALRVGDGQVISQVLSLRDVTHESLVDQMKSEFLSTAAHELRTPMASIFGFVELLIRRKMTPEKQADVLETIHRQSARMIAIINELLDLARIEARRGQDFVLETLDLNALLPEVLHDFKPPQEREPPGFALLPAPVWVRIDRNKLTQAVVNVLSNAYKYSPDGGAVHLRVLREPGVDGRPGRVGIEVRDAGIGMSADQLARVSERFYRADASGNIAGTGLGMSIVKEIIELLGGTLALASVPGQGTTVTLWLPRAAAPRQPGHASSDFLSLGA